MYSIVVRQKPLLVQKQVLNMLHANSPSLYVTKSSPASTAISRFRRAQGHTTPVGRLSSSGEPTFKPFKRVPGRVAKGANS
jgi:hypothetical protein